MNEIEQRTEEDLLYLYTSGTSIPFAQWNTLYSQHPLCQGLLWKQNGLFFQSGQPSPNTKDPVQLVHPMELNRTQRLAWKEIQKEAQVFFPQMEEAVPDPSSLRKERYSGAVVSFRDLIEQEPHGIFADIYTIGEDPIILFRLKDCRLTWSLQELRKPIEDSTLLLKDFSFTEWNRQVCHITSFLDRLTVAARACKDDPSIQEQLPSLSLEQLDAVFACLADRPCPTVRALLLEERRKRREETGFVL